MKKRVLIIGANSSLAADYISSNTSFDLILTSRHGELGYKLDLSAIETMDHALLTQSYDVAIVFAAISDISVCEKFPELAQKVNCDALIELFHKLSVEHWIFISTNSVFSGIEPNVSRDTPQDPITHYGVTKTSMEKSFIQHLEKVSIVRLTKVITSKFTLLSNLLSQAKCGKQVEIYENMFFAPITLAQVTEFLLNLSASRNSGIFQLSGSEDVSYYRAAIDLCLQHNLSLKLILPIKSPIKCPRYTSLKVTRTENDLGFLPKNYKQILLERYI